MPDLAHVIATLRQGRLQRILAFGSSNTERFQGGMHWFDCLDLGLRQGIAGRHHRCINTGISGHTTRDLLGRFEQDAAFYQPHAVFITIGGNDANPLRQLSEDQFRDNLMELHRRFTAMDCAVAFQTYYAPDAHPDVDMAYLTRFYRNMDIVREVAGQTGSDLFDHLARWEPFRLKHPAHYALLMRDVMHVNPLGNLVMGLDITRRLQLPLDIGDPATWAKARQCQLLMDDALRNA